MPYPGGGTRECQQCTLAVVSLHLLLAETMLRLEQGQRVALSEALRDLANLVAAVLVLGQLVGERPLSWSLVVLGFATWAGFVWLGLALVGGKRR